MTPFFVFNIEETKCQLATFIFQLTTLNYSPPMEQALPLPLFQPSTVVLANLRQFARTFRPQPYLVALA